MVFASELGKSDPKFIYPSICLFSIIGGFIATMFSGKKWFVVPSVLVGCLSVYFLIVVSAIQNEPQTMDSLPISELIWEAVAVNSFRALGIGVGVWLGYIVFIRPLPDDGPNKG